ncbi:MAG: phage holin family protein [Ginsengibacter sp.]
MENKPTDIEELFYKLKEYGDTRLELFKLKSVNKISGILSTMLVLLILVILLFLVLVCITIGIALLLGAWLGKAYYGFFIIGGIYIIIGLVLYSRRDKYLKIPISNKLIKELLD